MDCRLELLGHEHNLLRSASPTPSYVPVNNCDPGGDDLQMKGWDIRQSFDQPMFVNKRYVVIPASQPVNHYILRWLVLTQESRPFNPILMLNTWSRWGGNNILVFFRPKEYLNSFLFASMMQLR